MSFADLPPDMQKKLRKVFCATNTKTPLMSQEEFDSALLVQICEFQRTSLYNCCHYCYHPERMGNTHCKPSMMSCPLGLEKDPPDLHTFIKIEPRKNTSELSKKVLTWDKP